MKEGANKGDNRIYRHQLATVEDLQLLKQEILGEIRSLFKSNNIQPVKKWLKSHEVRKILNISSGTLQALRVKGTLPYTRIGGVIYYEYGDIQSMLDTAKQK